MKHPRLVAALVAAAGLPALAACTSNSTTSSSDGSGSGSRTITVTSTDDACTLSADTAPAGNLVFKVKNTGDKVTEFYLSPRTACASSARSRTSARACPATSW